MCGVARDLLAKRVLYRGILIVFGTLDVVPKVSSLTYGVNQSVGT